MVLRGVSFFLFGEGQIKSVWDFEAQRQVNEYYCDGLAVVSESDETRGVAHDAMARTCTVRVPRKAFRFRGPARTQDEYSYFLAGRDG